MVRVANKPQRGCDHTSPEAKAGIIIVVVPASCLSRRHSVLHSSLLHPLPLLSSLPIIPATRLSLAPADVAPRAFVSPIRAWTRRKKTF